MHCIPRIFCKFSHIILQDFLTSQFFRVGVLPRLCSLLCKSSWHVQFELFCRFGESEICCSAFKLSIPVHYAIGTLRSKVQLSKPSDKLANRSLRILNVRMHAASCSIAERNYGMLQGHVSGSNWGLRRLLGHVRLVSSV